jgi:hypothetical protein
MHRIHAAAGRKWLRIRPANTAYNFLDLTPTTLLATADEVIE